MPNTFTGTHKKQSLLSKFKKKSVHTRYSMKGIFFSNLETYRSETEKLRISNQYGYSATPHPHSRTARSRLDVIYNFRHCESMETASVLRVARPIIVALLFYERIYSLFNNSISLECMKCHETKKNYYLWIKNYIRELPCIRAISMHVHYYYAVLWGIGAQLRMPATGECHIVLLEVGV